MFALVAIAGWGLFLNSANLERWLSNPSIDGNVAVNPPPSPADEVPDDRKVDLRRVEQLEREIKALSDQLASRRLEPSATQTIQVPKADASAAAGSVVPTTLRDIASESDKLATKMGEVHAAYERDLDVLNAQIEQLRKRLAAEEGRPPSEVTDSEESRQTLVARLSAVEADFSARGAELERLQADIVVLAEHATEQESQLTQRLRASEYERLVLAESLERVQQQNRARNLEIAAYQTESQALSNNLREEESLLAKARASLNERLKVRDTLRRQLQSPDIDAQRMKEIRAQIIEVEQEILKHREEIAQARDRIALLESQLVEVNRKAASLLGQVERLQGERTLAERELEDLKGRFSAELERRAVEIRSLREKTALIRVDSDILYESGSTRLTQDGFDILDRVGVYLDDYPDRIVSLEGHTDNVPISSGKLRLFPSNWELSAARAARAARYLERRGVSPDRLRVVGYGPNRPVGDNTTEAGRALNRRLEMVLETTSAALRPAPRN